MKTMKEFIEELKKKIAPYIDEDIYGDNFNIIVHNINNTNSSQTGMTIFHKSDNNNSISPICYIEPMYEAYKKGAKISQIARDMAKVYNNVNNFVSNGIATTPEEIKEKITNGEVTFELCNTESNREMLKDMPHREWHDLSIIYNVCLGNLDEDHVSIAKINNFLLEMAGVTEEDLYRMAIHRVAYTVTPVALPMEHDRKNIKEGSPCVITTPSEEDGSIFLMYPDVFERLSEIYDEKDLVIVAMNKDALMVFPVNDEFEEAIKDINGKNGLTDCIMLGNLEDTIPDARLSNNAFIYKHDTNTIEIFAEAKEKSVDEKVLKKAKKKKERSDKYE